jgi:hypothetical protein
LIKPKPIFWFAFVVEMSARSKLKWAYDFYMAHVKKLYWIFITILFTYIMKNIMVNLTDAFNASSITFTMNTL